MEKASFLFVMILLRTLTNLYTLTFCYRQRDITNETIYVYFFLWVKSTIDIYSVRLPTKSINLTLTAVMVIQFQWFAELRPERGSFIGISDCYLRIGEDALFVR